MATISKFYFHDAATPNTGIMPTGAFVSSGDTTGDATGARTARDATDVIGTLQTSATITATANTSTQSWGYRRFVSRPLAAQTIPFSGIWTFSYARAESNLAHNMSANLNIYVWRPSTGVSVGGVIINASGTEPTVAATEQAESVSTAASSDVACNAGDILVFEVGDAFIQGMSTAYTSTFYYDGTTEASATSCASFVTPPSALTLFAATTPSLPNYSRVARNMLLRR